MHLTTLSLHTLNLAACVLIAGTAIAHLGPQPPALGIIAAQAGPARLPGPDSDPRPTVPALSHSARPAPRPDALCLALNAYHEARGEKDRGMAAVSHVVINRAKAGYRGKTDICATVFDPVQFSWTHQNPAPPEPAAFAHVKDLAKGVLAGRYLDRVPGAMHYYNPAKVTASWAHAYSEVAVVGNHRFMK